jgi:hypothetical protein
MCCSTDSQTPFSYETPPPPHLTSLVYKAIPINIHSLLFFSFKVVSSIIGVLLEEKNDQTHRSQLNPTRKSSFYQAGQSRQATLEEFFSRNSSGAASQASHHSYSAGRQQN